MNTTQSLEVSLGLRVVSEVMKLCFVILLFLSVNASGQTSLDIIKVVNVKFNDELSFKGGKISRVANYNSEKQLDGRYKLVFIPDSGQAVTLAEGTYFLGWMKGEFIWRYPSNNIKRTGQFYFSKDKTLKVSRFWDNYFNISIKETGIPDGKVIEYYDTLVAVKKEEVQYEKGVKNGPYFHWHKNGQVMKESFFVKGNESGIFREYYGNGQLKCIGKITPNGYDSTLVRYDLDGKLIEVLHFDKGVRINNDTLKTNAGGNATGKNTYYHYGSGGVPNALKTPTFISDSELDSLNIEFVKYIEKSKGSINSRQAYLVWIEISPLTGKVEKVQFTGASQYGTLLNRFFIDKTFHSLLKQELKMRLITYYFLLSIDKEY